MKGVGEVHAFTVPCQSLTHGQSLTHERFVLAPCIGQGQQRFQRPIYGQGVKPVEAAQDLFSFEQHSLGENDNFDFEQTSSLVRLPGLVGREQTDDDVGIGRDDDDPAVRLRWWDPFLPWNGRRL